MAVGPVFSFSRHWLWQGRKGPDLPGLLGLEGFPVSGRISRVKEEQAGGRARPGSVAVPKGERAGVPPSQWPGCSPVSGAPRSRTAGGEGLPRYLWV